MKDRFECPEAPKDDFDLGVFGREYRLLGSRLRIGAGTTGKMSKHPRAMIKVKLRGKDLGICLAGDEKGFGRISAISSAVSVGGGAKSYFVISCCIPRASGRWP